MTGKWGQLTFGNKLTVFYSKFLEWRSGFIYFSWDNFDVLFVLQEVSKNKYIKLKMPFGYEDPFGDIKSFEDILLFGYYDLQSVITGSFYYDFDNCGEKELIVTGEGSDRQWIDNVTTRYNEKTKKYDSVGSYSTVPIRGYYVFKQDSTNNITRVFDENIYCGECSKDQEHKYWTSKDYINYFNKNKKMN